MSVRNRLAIQGLLLLCACQLCSAEPLRRQVVDRTANKAPATTTEMATPDFGRHRWVIDDDERLQVELMKNISSECYQSHSECNSRCSVSCDESDDCDGVRGTWYRCSSNYWLPIILAVVLILFLVVLFVACQCVEKGQGCDSVDLYPRILGNHRRSQRPRAGINTVQYFTAVRRGEAGRQSRKGSAISSSNSMSQPRASISSQTPLSVSSSPYRFL